MGYGKIVFNTRPGNIEFTFYCCDDCGSLVADLDIHTAHHETLDRISANAAKGNTAWGMQQPLGGR
jgi:hypothetical protein